MLRLNTIYSHLLGKLLDKRQQLVMMMPILIFVLRVFGVITSNMLFLMHVSVLIP